MAEMSNGTKVALGLGAVAGLGVFLFSRKSSASTDSTTPTGDADAKILADAAAKGCAEGAADKAAGKPSKVAATTGFEASPSTASAAHDKAYQSCYGLGTVSVTGKDPVKTPPGPSKPAEKPGVYYPSHAKDKARAHSLAYAIGHSPPVGVPFGCDDPFAIGGKSYCSLAAFVSYDPNRAGLAALQEAAGLPVTGKYDSMSQQAFDYWFSHTS